jgi:DNA-binding IclR family transcriptional regulator
MSDLNNKQKVLQALGEKLWYSRDLSKKLGIPKKEVDKMIQELIQEGKAAYWSSGSTSYVTSVDKYREVEKKREETF